jgi:hypothetical protein
MQLSFKTKGESKGFVRACSYTLTSLTNVVDRTQSK